jgi:hypothetical protein
MNIEQIDRFLLKFKLFLKTKYENKNVEGIIFFFLNETYQEK